MRAAAAALWRVSAVVACTVALGGCVGLAAGGAATGAAIVHDRRTAGTFIDDQAIEIKALKHILEDPELSERAHINVTCYNLVALVTGEAPDEALRQRAVEIVRNLPKVRHVYDEIAIAAPSSMVSRSSDALITAKVKTKLFTLEGFDANRVKVVTERGIVYLMGLLTDAEAQRVVTTARAVGGVQKVVTLFERAADTA